MQRRSPSPPSDATPAWLAQLGGPIRDVLTKLHKRAVAANDTATVAAIHQVADGGRVSVRHVARAFDMLAAGRDAHDILKVLRPVPKPAPDATGDPSKASRPNPPNNTNSPPPDALTFRREAFGDPGTDTATPTTENAPSHSRRCTRAPPSINSPASLPSLWWQADRYVTDFHAKRTAEEAEASNAAGILWTRAVEGGTQRAAAPELRRRALWYEDRWWLDGPDYRREWQLTADDEDAWWKSATHHEDWRTGGDRWSRVDEASDDAADSDVINFRATWYEAHPGGRDESWARAYPDPAAPPCNPAERRRRSGLYRLGTWWRTPYLRALAIADPVAAQAALVSNDNQGPLDGAFAAACLAMLTLLTQDAALEPAVPLSVHLSGSHAPSDADRAALCTAVSAALGRVPQPPPVAGLCFSDDDGDDDEEARDGDNNGHADPRVGAAVFEAACMLAGDAAPLNENASAERGGAMDDGEAVGGDDDADDDDASWEAASGYDFGDAPPAADDDGFVSGADDDGFVSGEEDFSDWPSDDDIIDEDDGQGGATDANYQPVPNNDACTDLLDDTTDACGAIDADPSATQPGTADVTPCSVERVTAPEPWRVPLPTLVAPQDFRRVFSVAKLPDAVARGGMEESLFRRRKRQAWVLDHFAASCRCFVSMDDAHRSLLAADGGAKAKAIKPYREHDAVSLLSVEKDVVDATRVVLLFKDAKLGVKRYTLLCESAAERNAFFECAHAMRPSSRVYAPHLCHPDRTVVHPTTLVDAIGPNSVLLSTATDGLRSFSGECKVNASRHVTEPMRVCVVTSNAADATPEKGALTWLTPLAADADIIAIALHGVSNVAEADSAVIAALASSGSAFVVVASQPVGTTAFVVCARRQHLPKISGVAGTSVVTRHRAACGAIGGSAIAMSVYESRLVFVACRLPARPERHALRREVLSEVMHAVESTPATAPASADHTFVFGEMNSCIDPEMILSADARALAAEDPTALVDFDQLTTDLNDPVDERDVEGSSCLSYLTEAAPIAFGPTFTPERQDAMPGYPARVLRAHANSSPPPAVRCYRYGPCDDAAEQQQHQPVCAAFAVSIVRPAATLGNGGGDVSPDAVVVLSDVVISGLPESIRRHESALRLSADGRLLEQRAMPVAVSAVGDDGIGANAELVLSPTTGVLAALGHSTLAIRFTSAASPTRGRPDALPTAYAVLASALRDAIATGSSTFERVPMVASGRTIGFVSATVSYL